jgi:hypothetical protein
MNQNKEPRQINNKPSRIPLFEHPVRYGKRLLGVGALVVGVAAGGNWVIDHGSGNKVEQSANISGAHLAANSKKESPVSVHKLLLGKPNTIKNGENIMVTFGGKVVEKAGGNPNGSPIISSLADLVIQNTAGYGNKAATNVNINTVSVQGDKAINEYWNVLPAGIGYVQSGSSHEFEVTSGTDVAELSKNALQDDILVRPVVAPGK